MAWLDSTEITNARKLYAQVTYEDFMQGAFADDAAIESFIDEYLLPSVESHIEAYCDRDFDAEYPSAIPGAIKDVASRAIANMLQYMVMNKMGPLVRTGDFKLEIPEQEILTPGLRALLSPWVKRTPIVKSSDYAVIDE